MTYQGELAADGSLVWGFDYDEQVFVRDGKVEDCGHPDAMACRCVARIWRGKPHGELQRRQRIARAGEGGVEG